eukprot:s896_g24.t1
MNRAVIPCGAIAGFSFLGWNWLKGEIPGLAAKTLIHLIDPQWPLVVDNYHPIHSWSDSVWTLGSVFILWHSWREVVWVARAILGVIYWLLCLLGSSLQAFWWHQVLITRFFQVARTDQHSATEQEGFFTWHIMAGAGAAVPLPVGTFVLVSRPPEWDEVMIAGFSDDHTVALTRTTTPDGGNWAWVLVQVNGLHMRLPQVQGDGSRRAPQGIDENNCNWVCSPPAGANQWRPGAAEVNNITAEANLVLAQYRSNPAGWALNQPGVAGELQAMTMQQAGPVAPGGVAGGGALALGNAGALALGLGNAAEASSPKHPDLKALENAVQQLQAMALSPSNSNRGRDKSKKKKKDRKKKKKKKKRSGSSSSTSSSSRSRSGSGSSASSEGKKKPLRWKMDGKDRRVPLASLTHVDQLKFKKRGDLVAFAARHPGALTAHFLASVYTRLSKGSLTRSSQLRDVSVTSWAQQFSGLTEVRDLKEVVTLAEILDAVNREEISQALDVLCQRILAIQSAKTKGGTWEKAEAIELVDNRKSLASTSMLALTNQ